MIDHPIAQSIAQCALATGCGSVGLLKWFNVVAIPEFIVYGTAIIVAWQLLSLGYKALCWLGIIDRPDRSQDGTHY